VLNLTDPAKVFRVILESGPTRGQALDLPSEAVDAGRESRCFLFLKDQKVSRRHFRLIPEGEGTVLEDCGSSNGTYVNGRRIEKRVNLRSGDLIRAGDTFLSYGTEPSDALLGRTLGGYRLEARIGRGGMGTVYRARQLTLDRVVAIKVLAPALTEDREFAGRFLEEARLAARLDHPNVVRIYDAARDGRHDFLSMEYMASGSLQERLDRLGKLPWLEAVGIALDAAGALVWASEIGIVHRDIKPENILFGATGAAKVADFGVAADLRTSKTLYAGGKVLGTPGYMAPEQALGLPVDHRADMYALGSTLYAALTGSPPYEGDTPIAVLLRKTREDPVPIARAAPRTPRDVAGIVEKMMAREPVDRFATAVEAHAALERAWAGGRAAASGKLGGRISKVLRGALERLAPGKRTEEDPRRESPGE